MARKRKSKPPKLGALLDLLELRQALAQNCTSLKAVVLLMQKGKPEAAMARLEGAVSVLESTLRNQLQQFQAECPSCGSPQGLKAWADTQTCSECGEHLSADESNG